MTPDGCRVMTNCHKTHNKAVREAPDSSRKGLFLSIFLLKGIGRSCVLHPLGCGNILVFNQEDSGAGLHLHLCFFVHHECACYTINDNGSDGCHVCFTAREFAAGNNVCRLDGAIIKLTDVFTAEQENCSMHNLFYHNCGYANAVVLSYVT